jgi:hypothetical protein
MTKIKNIYCFGTSFTVGGGFEFHKDSKLVSLYKHLGIELVQYNFSWPGLLQSLIGDDIKVHNLAKSGYGNERIYRKTLDVVESKYGNVDDSLFIFEFSGLGRKEYFFNELDDYVICNYNFDEKETANALMHGIANGYFEDTPEIKKLLSDNEELFKKFMEKTINFKNQHIVYERNLLLFISFLDSNNINYLINGNLFLSPKFGKTLPDVSNKVLLFPNDTNKPGDFVQYFNSHNLSLTKETRGVIKDGHCGYVGNKIISEMIHNQLIDYGYLNSNKIKLTDHKIDLIFKPTGFNENTNFLEII